MADNPHLTTKCCGGRGGIGKMQPLRLIVDSRGRVPLNAHIFKPPGEVLLAVAAPLNSTRKEKFAEAGAEVLELPTRGGSVDIIELFKLLGKREIVAVLVEGGGKLLVGTDVVSLLVQNMRNTLFELIVDISVFQRSGSFLTDCDSKHGRDIGIST